MYVSVSPTHLISGDHKLTIWKTGIQLIVHFTVVRLVAKPLNRNEAKSDLVMIQTLLLFKFKLLCYHANKILVSITTRSPLASLQIKGLATKYTTVKWPIGEEPPYMTCKCVMYCQTTEKLDIA